MTVFACGACGDGLTGPVRRVPLPEERWISPPHTSEPAAVPLMGPGVYAVDPEPYGDARVRGTYVLAPGEVRGALILERCEIGCLGIHGYKAPNLACVSCGAEIGSRTDDCAAWQETRLHPGAVSAERVDEHVPARDVEEVLGRAPFGDGGDADWLWFGRLAIGAAAVLARSGGLPLRFGARAEPVREFLAGALGGTAFEDPAGRAPGGFAFCDVVAGEPERPGGAVRLLGLVPRGGRAPDGFEAVPVDRRVWAYLADDPGRTARTRWRPGLAAAAHRDEPDHRGSAAEFRAEGRWAGRRDLARLLARRPESAEPRLAALLAGLAPRT
ncbi:hypothetical protein [Spirillospora sp. NPDC029432]|uniref:hypothetical protein n=1 Tax=Spirillospora sp. NPDC029432 TaxID=3154599 RepID=UPI0034522C05